MMQLFELYDIAHLIWKGYAASVARPPCKVNVIYVLLDSAHLLKLCITLSSGTFNICKACKPTHMLRTIICTILYNMSKTGTICTILFKIDNQDHVRFQTYCIVQQCTQNQS
jgi:hypothetical protein